MRAHRLLGRASYIIRSESIPSEGTTPSTPAIDHFHVGLFVRKLRSSSSENSCRDNLEDFLRDASSTTMCASPTRITLVSLCVTDLADTSMFRQEGVTTYSQLLFDVARQQVVVGARYVFLSWITLSLVYYLDIRNTNREKHPVFVQI